MDRYTIKVVAEDNGSPKKLSSTATVLLNVQDVNDNPPRFTRLHSINVTENTAIGTNLVKVETVDLDRPENAQVQYKFISNPDDAFDIQQHLKTTTAFIGRALKDNDAQVLIHCSAGRSRSVAVVNSAPPPTA